MDETAPRYRDDKTHWKDATRTIAKVAYPSRKVAKLKARHIKSQGGGERWPYACGECTGWHLSGSRRRDES
jgi:hypothetical protein